MRDADTLRFLLAVRDDGNDVAGEGGGGDLKRGMHDSNSCCAGRYNRAKWFHMTTNVLDLPSSIAATDSRWSMIIKNRWIVFVDDAEFEKIDVSYPYLSVFAGDGWLIQQWKDWMHSEKQEGPPPTERCGCMISVTVTDMPKGSVLFERGQQVAEEMARFAGSGAFHAYEHWKRNFDAVAAVKFAMSVDMFSGGSVKFYCFSTGENNLCDTIRLNDLRRKLKTEGWRIDMNSNAPAIKIADVLKDNEDFLAALEDAERGEGHFVAPDPAMYIPWTEDEKHRFVRLMTRIKEEVSKKQG
jgi:hypothetical protein